MTTSRKRRHCSKKLPDEAVISNGIYLDFEGFARSKHRAYCPPALCGYKDGADGPFAQVVFSQALKWPAREAGLDFVDRAEFLTTLINVHCRGRSLFAFTEHERDMIVRSGGPRVTRRYRNVRVFADRYLPNEAGDVATLPTVCERAGIPVPRDYGKGQVTAWLRSVKAHGSSRKQWMAAPPEARRAWTLLLEHNRFDVEVLPQLVRQFSTRRAEPKREAA